MWKKEVLSHRIAGELLPSLNWPIHYSITCAGASVAFFKLPYIEQQFILVFFADFVHVDRRETTEKKERKRKEGKKETKKNEKRTKEAIELKKWKIFHVVKGVIIK